jgi:hypothetical protein
MKYSVDSLVMGLLLLLLLLLMVLLHLPDGLGFAAAIFRDQVTGRIDGPLSNPAALGAGAVVGAVAAVGEGVNVKKKKRKPKYSPNPHEGPTSSQEEKDDSPTGAIYGCRYRAAATADRRFVLADRRFDLAYRTSDVRRTRSYA